MNGFQSPDFRPLFWLAMLGLVVFVLAIAFLPLVVVALMSAPSWAFVSAGIWAGIVLLAVAVVVYEVARL